MCCFYRDRGCCECTGSHSLLLQKGIPEATSREAFISFPLSRRRSWGGSGANMILRWSARARCPPVVADPVCPRGHSAGGCSEKIKQKQLFPAMQCQPCWQKRTGAGGHRGAPCYQSRAGHGIPLAWPGRRGKPELSKPALGAKLCTGMRKRFSGVTKGDYSLLH